MAALSSALALRMLRISLSLLALTIRWFVSFFLAITSSMRFRSTGKNLISISIPSPYLLLMCWGVPMHWKLPLTMMASRVASASASSMECVVRMIVDYFRSVAIFEITFHMNRLALGSMPVEGSSRKMIFGLPIMAMATDSFRLLPPDSVPDSLCSYSSKFSYFIFWLTNTSLYSSSSDLRS
jgi:hypothetical protein